MKKVSMKDHLFIRILLFLILLLSFSFSLAKIYDYDLWWHLKTGQYILKSLQVPYKDFFSLSSGGKEWIDVHWLSQVLLFTIFSLGGFSSIQLLTSSVIALTFFLLYRVRSHEITYGWFFLPLVYFAIYASKERFLPRPDIFSLFFASLSFFLLYRFHFHKERTIFFLPLLQIIWVNMHGSFILGPLLLLAFVTGQILDLLFFQQKKNVFLPEERRGEKIDSKRYDSKKAKLLTLLILLMIVLAVNVINPYGIKVFKIFVSYVESFHRYLRPVSQELPAVTIQEWLPTFSESASKYAHTFFPFYIFLAVIGFISFILQGRRFSGPLFLTSAGCFLLSLFAIRNVALFSVLMAPIAAHNFCEFFLHFPFKKIHRSFIKDLFPFVLFLTFSLVIVLSIFDVFSNSYYIRHYLPIETNFGISRSSFPMGAAQFLKEEKVIGHIYNNFEAGGYLIWSLYPQYKVFIDGRYIDPDFDRIYLKASQDYRKWNDLIDRYDIECVLLKFPSQDTSYLITALSASERWKIIYMDSNSVLFLKDSYRNLQIRNRYGLKLPEFHERAFMELSFFPFRSDLKGQSLEKELGKKWVDRFIRPMASYIETLQKDPFPVETLNKAFFLHLIGALKASIAEYQKVIHQYPFYEPAHFELGLLYWQLGDYQRCLKEMKGLLKRGLKNFDLFYYAGLASFHLQNNDEAIQFLENAIKWKSDDYSSHFMLSLAHLNRGHLDKAEFHMKRATKIHPDSAEAHFNLGSIYLMKQDQKNAREEFLKALECDPSFKDAQEELQKLMPPE